MNLAVKEMMHPTCCAGIVSFSAISLYSLEGKWTRSRSLGIAEFYRVVANRSGTEWTEWVAGDFQLWKVRSVCEAQFFILTHSFCCCFFVLFCPRNDFFFEFWETDGAHFFLYQQLHVLQPSLFLPEPIWKDFYVKNEKLRALGWFITGKIFYRALVSVSCCVTKQIDGSDRLVMSLWCQYSYLSYTCLLVWNTLFWTVLRPTRPLCMQKPNMAVTGDETGKNLKEGLH